MQHLGKLGLLGASLALAAGSAMAADCADGAGPKAAIESYLTAMQQHRFIDAYTFVSSNMTDAQSREDWAAQQKMFYEGGEVNLLSFDIRAPQAMADDAACAGKAQVPNVLESRDKFNNQGTLEFEVYTVIRDGEDWKVDAQETLFEQEQVDQWFPGEKMPEFRGQY